MKNVNIRDIVFEAKLEARIAASKFFSEVMDYTDGGACGFAWVNLYTYNGKKLDGRSKVAKLLKEAGVRQDWQKTFQFWNPSEYPCQNVDTLEAGAQAAAKVFRKYGFEAYAGSRLD